MNLYIIRHGETEWNRIHKLQGATNIPLNDTGKRQAAELRDELVRTGQTFDTVYVSPLDRALETAKIVTGLGESKLNIDSRIAEMNFGSYEGGPYNFNPEVDIPDVPENVMNMTLKPSKYVATDGESFEDVIARTGDFLKCIIAKHGDTDDNVLLVAHGASLHALLYNVKNKTDLDDFWQPRLGNCKIYKIKEVSGNM